MECMDLFGETLQSDFHKTVPDGKLMPVGILLEYGLPFLMFEVAST